MFDGFHSFFEQISARPAGFQLSDDIPTVSCEGFSFQNLEKGCEESEKHITTSEVSCKSDEVGREWCGETRFNNVLSSSGSEQSSKQERGESV